MGVRIVSLIVFPADEGESLKSQYAIAEVSIVIFFFRSEFKNPRFKKKVNSVSVISRWQRLLRVSPTASIVNKSSILVTSHLKTGGRKCYNMFYA